MAGGIDWFRWHHGSVTDPKFQLVARKAGARLGDVIAVWAFVLEKSSADLDRGTVGQLDFETIDFLLGADEGTAVRILDAMTARGLLVGNRIARWDERQPKRERDEAGASTDRVRAYRERKRHETPGNANSSHEAPDARRERPETPREEKSREEISSPDGEEKTPRKRAATPACPADVNEQTWADWLQLRKAKRAPVTTTVLDGARVEAIKAGMPLQQFLEIWCRRGTQGLEAAWLRDADRRGPQPARESFAERDRDAGMARWEQMTGRTHPDRSAPPGVVIDMPPNQLAIGGRP